jgi:uncharacterized damage-inducible protein DinB
MEPWLAGKHADLDPIRRLLACSLDHALGDLRHWTPEQPNAAIAFHLRHLAGSVDRLWTYALGGQLSEAQLAYLHAENQGPGDREELLAAIADRFGRVQTEIRMIEDLDYREPRYIGRQRVEVPLGLLLGHIAEHTQRHVGQLIALSKAA